jgi:hypothetical protein
VGGSHEQATVLGEGYRSHRLTELPFVHDVNAIAIEPTSQYSTLKNVDPTH